MISGLRSSIFLSKSITWLNHWSFLYLECRINLPLDAMHPGSLLPCKHFTHLRSCRHTRPNSSFQDHWSSHTQKYTSHRLRCTVCSCLYCCPCLLIPITFQKIEKVDFGLELQLTLVLDVSLVLEKTTVGNHPLNEEKKEITHSSISDYHN